MPNGTELDEILFGAMERELVPVGPTLHELALRELEQQDAAARARGETYDPEAADPGRVTRDYLPGTEPAPFPIRPEPPPRVSMGLEAETYEERATGRVARQPFPYHLYPEDETALRIEFRQEFINDLKRVQPGRDESYYDARWSEIQERANTYPMDRAPDRASTYPSTDEVREFVDANPGMSTSSRFPGFSLVAEQVQSGANDDEVLTFLLGLESWQLPPPLRPHGFSQIVGRVFTPRVIPLSTETPTHDQQFERVRQVERELREIGFFRSLSTAIGRNTDEMTREEAERMGIDLDELRESRGRVLGGTAGVIGGMVIGSGQAVRRTEQRLLASLIAEGIDPKTAAERAKAMAGRATTGLARTGWSAVGGGVGLIGTQILADIIVSPERYTTPYPLFGRGQGDDSYYFAIPGGWVDTAKTWSEISARVQTKLGLFDLYANLFLNDEDAERFHDQVDLSRPSEGFHALAGQIRYQQEHPDLAAQSYSNTLALFSALRMKDLPGPVRRASGEVPLSAVRRMVASDPSANATDQRRPHWAAVAQAVLSGETDEAVNRLLFEMPFAEYPLDLISYVLERQSGQEMQNAVEQWANEHVNEVEGAMEASGTRSSGRMLQHMMQASLSSRINEDGQGVLVENRIGQTFRAFGLAPDILLEIPIPYITPAGIDFSQNLGIRAEDSQWWSRVLAGVATGMSGPTIKYMEVMDAAGMDREGWAYRATQIPLVLSEFLIPWERYAFAVPYVGTRAGVHGVRYSREARAALGKGWAGQVALASVSPHAAAFVYDIPRTDPATGLPVYRDATSVIHYLIKNGALAKLDGGEDFVSAIPHETRRTTEEVIRVSEHDPRDVVAKVTAYDRRASSGAKTLIADMLDSGTPEMQALRASPEYEAFRSDLDARTARGEIDETRATYILSLLEIAANRLAVDDVNTSINTPADLFAQVRIILGGADVLSPGRRPGGRGVSKPVRDVGEGFARETERIAMTEDPPVAALADLDYEAARTQRTALLARLDDVEAKIRDLAAKSGTRKERGKRRERSVAELRSENRRLSGERDAIHAELAEYAKHLDWLSQRIGGPVGRSLSDVLGLLRPDEDITTVGDVQSIARALEIDVLSDGFGQFLDFLIGKRDLGEMEPHELHQLWVALEDGEFYSPALRREAAAQHWAHFDVPEELRGADELVLRLREEADEGHTSHAQVALLEWFISRFEKSGVLDRVTLKKPKAWTFRKTGEVWSTTQPVSDAVKIITAEIQMRQRKVKIDVPTPRIEGTPQEIAASIVADALGHLRRKRTRAAGESIKVRAAELAQRVVDGDLTKGDVLQEIRNALGHADHREFLEAFGEGDANKGIAKAHDIIVKRFKAEFFARVSPETFAFHIVHELFHGLHLTGLSDAELAVLRRAYLADLDAGFQGLGDVVRNLPDRTEIQFSEWLAQISTQYLVFNKLPESALRMDTYSTIKKAVDKLVKYVKDIWYSLYNKPPRELGSIPEEIIDFVDRLLDGKLEVATTAELVARWELLRGMDQDLGAVAGPHDLPHVVADPVPGYIKVEADGTHVVAGVRLHEVPADHPEKFGPKIGIDEMVEQHGEGVLIGRWVPELDETYTAWLNADETAGYAISAAGEIVNMALSEQAILTGQGLGMLLHAIKMGAKTVTVQENGPYAHLLHNVGFVPHRIEEISDGVLAITMQFREGLDRATIENRAGTFGDYKAVESPPKLESRTDEPLSSGNLPEAVVESLEGASREGLRGPAERAAAEAEDVRAAEARAEALSVLGRPPARFAERAHGGEYEVVHVDPARVDEAWQRDAPRYVEPGGKPTSESRAKYNAAGEFLQSGRPVEMPILSIRQTKDTKVFPRFADGSHIFAALRDQGAESIPVMVPVEQAVRVAQEFLSPRPPEFEVMSYLESTRRRILVGITGARDEFPEFAGRWDEFRAFSDELEALADSVQSKQGGKWGREQASHKDLLLDEMNRGLGEMYDLMEPDLQRVLTENVAPEHITIESLHANRLIRRGVGGWAGDPSEATLYVELRGDPEIVLGRLAMFSKAYDQGGMLVRTAREEVSGIDTNEFINRAVPLPDSTRNSLVYLDAGGVRRGATVRFVLPESAKDASRIVPVLDTLKKIDPDTGERAFQTGFTYLPEAGIIEIAHTPEWGAGSAETHIYMMREIGEALSEYLAKNNFGELNLAFLHEDMDFGGSVALSSREGYTVHGYDDLIRRGLEREAPTPDARRSGKSGTISPRAAGGARTWAGAGSEPPIPGGGSRTGPRDPAGGIDQGDGLPGTSGASMGRVARDLTGELGKHLDRRGATPHRVVADNLKAKLEASDLSEAARSEAIAKLRLDEVNPLEEPDLSVTVHFRDRREKAGAAPVKMNISLIRTDGFPALVPGGLSGEFSFPDLDYLHRRPVLLDPPLRLDEIAGADSQTLVDTWKRIGIPERVAEEAAGLVKSGDRKYTVGEIAKIFRSAQETYEELALRVYDKHSRSMGLGARPELARSPDGVLTPEARERLSVYLLDQLGIHILSVYSAGMNIVENQLLASAARPRSLRELSLLAKKIRDARARKTTYWAEMADQVSVPRADDLAKMSTEAIEAMMDLWRQAGVPENAILQAVGGELPEGVGPYSDASLRRLFTRAKSGLQNLNTEEAQYLLGLAITAGTRKEFKWWSPELIAKARRGGVHAWWDPTVPMQRWEWDAVRRINDEKIRHNQKLALLEHDAATMASAHLADQVALRERELEIADTGVNKNKMREDIDSLTRAKERADKRADDARDKVTKIENLLSTGGVAGDPVPRLTEGYSGIGKADSAYITDLIDLFEADFRRLERGEQDYSWYEKHPDEDWPTFQDRLNSSVRGMSSKVANFAPLLTDPATAVAVAIDTHWVKKIFYPFRHKGETDAAYKRRQKVLPGRRELFRHWYKAWQEGNGAVDTRVRRPGKDVLNMRKKASLQEYADGNTGDWVERVQILMSPRDMPLATRADGLDPAKAASRHRTARQQLRQSRASGETGAEMDQLVGKERRLAARARMQSESIKWLERYGADHPTVQRLMNGELEVSVTSDVYEAALKWVANDPEVKKGRSPGAIGWYRWDKMRRYLEPEMAVSSGASSIPGMKTASLMELRRELASLGFFRDPRSTRKNPRSRLYKRHQKEGLLVLYSKSDDVTPGHPVSIDAPTLEAVESVFHGTDPMGILADDGALLRSLLGDHWVENLFQQFSSTLGPDGGVTLTPLGVRQFKNAWHWFLATGHTSGGSLKYKFLEIKHSLQDLWHRVRTHQPDIPESARLYWDAALRPDHLVVQDAVRISSRTFKGFDTVRVALTPEERIQNEDIARAGRRKEALRVDLRPDRVKQALGITDETTSMPANELFANALAYVVTERLRRKAGGAPWVSLTKRTYIPRSRAKKILARMRARMQDALGMRAKDLPRDQIQTGEDGVHWVLTEPQQANVRVLLRELAAQPLGERLPMHLVDEGADLSHIHVNDMHTIREVIIDVEAGPGSRRTFYAKTIAPTVGYLIWNALKSAAGDIGKSDNTAKRVISQLRTMFVIPDNLEKIDPVMAELIVEHLAGMQEIPRDVVRLVSKSMKDNPDQTLGEVYSMLRETLTPFISPGAVRELWDFKEMFSGMAAAEAAAIRAATGPEDAAGVRASVTEDIDGGIDLADVFNRRHRIQEIMQDSSPTGRLDELEVQAFQDLERAFLKRNRGVELNVDERYVLGDALRIIHNGLDRRWTVVEDDAIQIGISLAGSKDSNIWLGRTYKDYIKVYELFYTGQWVNLFDWASTERGQASGLNPNRVPDYNMAEGILEMLVRMMAREKIRGLSSRLAEYGTNLDVSKLTENIELGDVDRGLFVERVRFYINNIISWDTFTAIAETEEGHFTTIKRPTAPHVDKGVSTYPMWEQRFSDPIDTIGNRHDMNAFTVASQILEQWGYKYGKGEWKPYTLPDGTEALLPQGVIDEIEGSIDRAASIGQAYRSAHAPIAPDILNTPLDIKLAARAPAVKEKMALSKAVGTLLRLFPTSARHVRMGVTTGIVIPNPAYYTGVGLGAMLQAYQGAGVRGVKTTFTHPRLIWSVVARMWGHGKYRPDAPHIVTKDYRVFSPDLLAEQFARAGLKSSWIRSETAPSLVKQIKSEMPGAWNKLRSVFEKEQGVLIEFATALDTWWRVGVAIDALYKGESMSSATKMARLTGYDYAALTRFEKTVMRNTVLFYSYMRKNMDLFWDTMLTNPHRVIGQMRMLRGLHHAYLEDDPQVILRSWDQPRLPVYFREVAGTNHVKGKVMWIAPPIPFYDALSFWIDLADLGEDRGVRATAARFAPWVAAPFVLATETDIFFGRDVNEFNKVPAWLIEADRAMTGGMIVDDLLHVQWRVSYDPAQEDVPRQGYWHARNGKAWYLYRSLLQFPFAGRGMFTQESLDRTDLGPMEVFLAAARGLRKRGVEGGWLDPVDLTFEDTATAREGLTKSSEIATYLGLKARLLDTRVTAVDRMLREHREELEEEIKELRRSDPYYYHR